MKQLSLIDYQETSKEAYKKIFFKAGMKSLYGKIIMLLENYPDGYSINELSQILQSERSTISPRIKELRDVGILRHSEERESFVTNNRNMIWVLADGYKENIEMIE
jgi:DNA-binding transcriptional regulator GbsR (MarR family)